MYENDDKKRYYIVDSMPLYRPNHAQLQSSVLPEDKRYKRAPFKKFLFWLVARPWFWAAAILFGYAYFKS